MIVTIFTCVFFFIVDRFNHALGFITHLKTWQHIQEVKIVCGCPHALKRNIFHKDNVKLIVHTLLCSGSLSQRDT